MNMAAQWALFKTTSPTLPWQRPGQHLGRSETINTALLMERGLLIWVSILSLKMAPDRSNQYHQLLGSIG